MNATAWRSHVLFGLSHELFGNSCVACLYTLVKKRGRETDSWRRSSSSHTSGHSTVNRNYHSFTRASSYHPIMYFA